MAYKEIEGNLFTLAEQGMFNVIAHGCNCFCKQNKGIAKEFKDRYCTDDIRFYEMESAAHIGDKSKLGKIEVAYWNYEDDSSCNQLLETEKEKIFAVVNCYTQYYYGKKYGNPFDYLAFTLCMNKLNSQFKGQRIGLPQIGSGLAGGNWNIIKDIIIQELCDCDVTIVKLK